MRLGSKAEGRRGDEAKAATTPLPMRENGALGGSAVLGYTGPMTRPLPLIAGLLGVVFLALAAVYCFVRAGSLPSFLPGFEASSEHVHLKHALGSLIVALVLFAVAWFSGRPQRR
jgi:hypothetical protein